MRIDRASAATREAAETLTKWAHLHSLHKQAEYRSLHFLAGGRNAHIEEQERAPTGERASAIEGGAHPQRIGRVGDSAGVALADGGGER